MSGALEVCRSAVHAVRCMQQDWGWPSCWLPGHQHAASKAVEGAGVRELVETDGCLTAHKCWWQAYTRAHGSVASACHSSSWVGSRACPGLHRGFIAAGCMRGVRLAMQVCYSCLLACMLLQAACLIWHPGLAEVRSTPVLTSNLPGVHGSQGACLSTSKMLDSQAWGRMCRLTTAPPLRPVLCAAPGTTVSCCLQWACDSPGQPCAAEGI